MGRDIDVKAARYMRAAGSAICNRRATNVAGILPESVPTMDLQAWRYFPANLMGKALVDYLSAIQGGEADNATLVYGNPQPFLQA